jgi:hypothetical protein
VWGGYGSTPQQYTELYWAANRLPVYKPCEAPCEWSRDPSFKETSDVVLIETLNAIKFGHAETLNDLYGSGIMPPLTQNPQPVKAMVYFEPFNEFPAATMGPIRDLFDFFLEPTSPPDADPSKIIRTSMICEWMLQPPAGMPRYPSEQPPKNIAEWAGFGLDTYFMHTAKAFADRKLLIWHHDPNHGIASAFRKFQHDFQRDATGTRGADWSSANVDFSRKHKSLEDTRDRIAALDDYRFVLVTEFQHMRDWVEMEIVQGFIVGAVPVYMGAPNVEEFTLGGKGTYIDVVGDGWMDKPANELVDFLVNMDEQTYNTYTVWKRDGPANVQPSFKQKLTQCVYNAECRLCEAAHQKLGTVTLG